MGKKGRINPLTGVTDGKLNQMLRSALRQIWGYTRKKQYIKSVRYKKGKRYYVKCAQCDLEMWVNDKKKPLNKDGSVSKRKPQRLFDVDHIDGITPLDDPIYGVGPYWESMMVGELQVLCKPCHAEKTYSKEGE